MKPNAPIFPVVVDGVVKHYGMRVRMLAALVAWHSTLRSTPEHIHTGMSYKSRYMLARKAIDSADAFLQAFRDDLQEDKAEEHSSGHA